MVDSYENFMDLSMTDISCFFFSLTVTVTGPKRLDSESWSDILESVSAKY